MPRGVLLHALTISSLVGPSKQAPTRLPFPLQVTLGTINQLAPSWTYVGVPLVSSTQGCLAQRQLEAGSSSMKHATCPCIYSHNILFHEFLYSVSCFPHCISSQQYCVQQFYYFMYVSSLGYQRPLKISLFPCLYLYVDLQHSDVFFPLHSAVIIKIR